MSFLSGPPPDKSHRILDSKARSAIGEEGGFDAKCSFRSDARRHRKRTSGAKALIMSVYLRHGWTRALRLSWRTHSESSSGKTKSASLQSFTARPNWCPSP